MPSSTVLAHAASLRHQLHLHTSVYTCTQVMDLFREWDVDGDGEVSKKEFHRAMPALGLDVPKKEVEALFDSWDKDGGGSLGYKELTKILRSQGDHRSQASKTVKAMTTAAAAVSRMKMGGGGAPAGAPTAAATLLKNVAKRPANVDTP